ncbi:MAG: hypothetical protein JWP18_2333 [Solirubrobacterales bacterium]|jgi:hypothetical protein|nr:hypothetical protein [Solirubrobacterales bacterium]
MKAVPHPGAAGIQRPAALETVRALLATDPSSFLSEEGFREVEAASQVLAGARRGLTDAGGREGRR